MKSVQRLKTAASKIVLVLIALLVGGCNVVWRDTWAVDSRYAALLAAQTRRSELIKEVELLERLLRRTVAIDNRAMLQSAINRKRFEIEQLNAIIER